MSNLLVTLDSVRYIDKPQGSEIAQITKRLQAAGPVEIAAEDFAFRVARGLTWCGGCYEPCESGWGAFVGQQVFGLDFDNSRATADAAGDSMKAPLYPGERGYLRLDDAVRRCEAEGLALIADYWTFSARPGWPRFRLVIAAPEPFASQDEAEAFLAWLMRIFPECDGQCKNTNRLFFGANQRFLERALRSWGC